MGCGASICNKLRAGSDHATPLLASDHQRGLVTPPGSRRTSRQAPLVTNGKAFGLKIDTGMTTREKAGLAETPMGKAADEYKYYCPLCMMFFKSIIELPCCKQSTCAFCFGEYLQRQLNANPDDVPLRAEVSAVSIAGADLEVRLEHEPEP